MLIALSTLISTLLIYQLQRRPMLFTLRALGLSTTELIQLFFLQALLIGTTAALFAVPLGYWLGWLLVDWINPAAFGWRLAFQPMPMVSVNGALA